jgi:chaperonin cofactor prefoldin
MKRQRFYLCLLIICSVFSLTRTGYTEDLTSINQTNLNLVERIARLEEGQKAIIVEMRTRFESVDKRFESFDKRFESMDKRFDSMDKRFDSMDKRFDSLVREMTHGFETMNKRIDSLENQISNHGNYIFAMFAAIIALMAYVIWDRKTAFDKAFSETFTKIEQMFQLFTKIEQMFQLHIEKFHPVDSVAQHKEDANEPNKIPVNYQQNEGFTIPESIQNKFRDVVNFMNQFPEMRPIMNAKA